MGIRRRKINRFLRHHGRLLLVLTVILLLTISGRWSRIKAYEQPTNQFPGAPKMVEVAATASARISERVATISATPAATTSGTPAPIPPARDRFETGAIGAYIRTKSWDARTASAVAYCESSFRPWIIGPINRDGSIGNKNGTKDYGLFGINSIHGYPVEKLLDPTFNTDVAFELWKTQGWTPWASSFNNGCVSKNISRFIDLL